ncbi:MAG TPA: hypothetical protein VFH23_06745 [Jiangellaceae bacterium]|jgi:hypothetical protein|nr:hypothetical protein [Jiangellaceae bacterium]
MLRARLLSAAAGMVLKLDLVAHRSRRSVQLKWGKCVKKKRKKK